MESAGGQVEMTGAVLSFAVVTLVEAVAVHPRSSVTVTE